MWWKVFYHCALIIAIWEVQALQLFSPSCLVLEGPARIYFPFVDSFRNISFTNFTKEGNQLILKLKTLLYISSSPFVYLWLWGRARDWKIRRKKIRRIKHLLKSISPLYFWDENLPEIFKIKGTWNFFFFRRGRKVGAGLLKCNCSGQEGRLYCKSTVMSLLPQSRVHPQGFRREDRWECWGKISASVKAPARDLPAAILLQNLCLCSRGSTEKGNQNLLIGKPLWELRFQASSFLLTSLISHQSFPCILHFFRDSNLYFCATAILLN